MNVRNSIFFSLMACSLLVSACGEKESGGPLPEAPDAAIEAISLRLSQGDAGVLWQAMPETYRNDLTQIAHEAGAVVDAEIYDRSFGLVGKIADIAEKQKEFILNSQFSKSLDTEAARANWTPVVNFIRLIATSEIATASGLQNLDLKGFFDGTGSKFLGYLEELSALSGEESPLAQLATLKATLVEAGEGTALLSIEIPGEAVKTQSFSKVEDKWVPAEMAAGWTAQIAEAKARLQEAASATATQNRPQIVGILTMFDGVLAQLEAAETQQQFDQALQGAMMPMMGLMMLGNSIGGGGAAPALPQAPVVPTVPGGVQ